MSDFEKAAEEVKNLSKKPNNDEMLKLYGLYKVILLDPYGVVLVFYFSTWSGFNAKKLNVKMYSETK